MVREYTENPELTAFVDVDLEDFNEKDLYGAGVGSHDSFRVNNLCNTTLGDTAKDYIAVSRFIPRQQLV